MSSGSGGDFGGGGGGRRFTTPAEEEAILDEERRRRALALARSDYYSSYPTMNRRAMGIGTVIAAALLAGGIYYYRTRIYFPRRVLRGEGTMGFHLLSKSGAFLRTEGDRVVLAPSDEQKTLSSHWQLQAIGSPSSSSPPSSYLLVSLLPHLASSGDDERGVGKPETKYVSTSAAGGVALSWQATTPDSVWVLDQDESDYTIRLKSAHTRASASASATATASTTTTTVRGMSLQINDDGIAELLPGAGEPFYIRPTCFLC